MLSMDNNNQSTNRSNSVVTGGMEDEAQRISSPSVFVPSTTDTDLNTTTAQPNGKDTIRVIFPCEDVRVKKKKKIADLKESLLFFCTTSIMKAKGLLPLPPKGKKEGQLGATQENKVGVFLVLNRFK